jgi:hypothetical protein
MRTYGTGPQVAHDIRPLWAKQLGTKIHLTREKFTAVPCMWIRRRNIRGNHGNIFNKIHASHLTELNLCWSRTMHNLILTYQLSMRPVKSHHLTGQHAINQVKSRSGNGQKGTDRGNGFAGVKTGGVRICPILKCLTTCWSPALEYMINIVRIYFVIINVVICAVNLLNITFSWSYNAGW